jgi:hypothetical protein
LDGVCGQFSRAFDVAGRQCFGERVCAFVDDAAPGFSAGLADAGGKIGSRCHQAVERCQSFVLRSYVSPLALCYLYVTYGPVAPGLAIIIL